MYKRGAWWLICLILQSEIIPNVRSEFSYEAVTAVLARINVSYVNPDSKKPESSAAEIGRFAEGAVGAAGGVLVTGTPPKNSTASRGLYLQGCFQKWAVPPTTGEPWVALLLRGGCSDEDKVKYALEQNASAVLLFGNDPEPYIPKHTQFRGDAVVVYLLKRRGELLASLVANGTKVYITISKGQEVKFRITSINRTSVLFVSVSFIVLMVVSLAWLIFYYIQRFRYINAKDRLAKHLNNAAKKALAKIPVKNIKNGDKEIDDSESCAVCIELYQVGDTLRSLPCKHEFHKGCVDPWLLEHRTCPMCKMDILKYYGYMPSEAETTVSGAGAANTTPSAAEGTPTLVLGSARRSRNQTPSSARAQDRSNSQGTLQVSVISHSNSITSNDNMESATPSNITSDISSSIPPSSKPISIEATTAIIRSVILSPNTQAAPVHYSNASLSNNVSPDNAVTSGDGSVVVNIGESNEGASPNQENVKIGSEEATNVRSPFEEDQGELVQVLYSRDPLVPPSNETSRPLSSLDVPLNKSIDSGEGCDEIDRLVSEIIDADSDDSREAKPSSNEGASSSVDSPQDSPSDNDVVSTSAIPIQLNNSCPSLPNNSQSQLPAVDCSTQFSLALGTPTENYASRRHSGNLYSSNNSHDFQELKRQDAGGGASSSDDTRRPSSHLVTISHS